MRRRANCSNNAACKRSKNERTNERTNPGAMVAVAVAVAVVGATGVAAAWRVVVVVNKR